jgi:hypothetical protein
MTQQTKQPREWTLAYDSNFDDTPPCVTEGPPISPNEQEVNVIEHSAYQALQKEIDELRTRMNGKLIDKNKELAEAKGAREDMRIQLSNETQALADAKAELAEFKKDCAYIHECDLKELTQANETIKSLQKQIFDLTPNEDPTE